MNEREMVAYYMQRLYHRGLTTALGGNVSLRSGGLMYITASSIDKGSIEAGEIAAVEIESGKVLDDNLTLSIESEMHRRIYLTRSDVNAVVHSHPLHASLFSAVEEEVDSRLTAEAWFMLGRVVKVPYALMGTEKLADNVADCAKTAEAMLLENHGALTLGSSLIRAFKRMEVLENVARMTALVNQSLHPLPLSREKLDEIGRAKI